MKWEVVFTYRKELLSAPFYASSLQDALRQWERDFRDEAYESTLISISLVTK